MADVNSSRIVIDSFKAGETIPVFAAVSALSTGEIVNTNWPDVTSVSNFLGIALTANFAGLFIDVCLFGVVENLAWSFIPLQPVYLYSSGMITQTNYGQVLRKIGVALTSTKLFINPSDLIMLAQ